MWNVIGKVLFSKHRDMFSVRLGTNLILLQLGIVPGSLTGEIVGWFFRGFLGYFIDSGVFVIDLGLDALREGKKLDEYRVEATAAYEYATAKVYDEAEKEKIRQTYLKIIAKIGAVGNGPSTP